MAIGNAGRKTGSIGKPLRTGDVGNSKARHHGTKFMTTMTGAKVQYPTTTTTVAPVATTTTT